MMTHANTYANNSDDELGYGDQSYRTLNPAEALHKYREGGNPQASTVIGGMIDNFELSHRKLQRRGERNSNLQTIPGMSPKKMKPQKFVHGTGMQNSPRAQGDPNTI